MGRINTCNELISAAQRDEVIKLVTETHRTYANIARSTGVPVSKIKRMTADMQRPVRGKPLTDWERTRLLMRW
jgi:uncharacterized protein YerC